MINGAANPRSRLPILAVLAVTGERGIRREKLAALFWPDSDEERARNALRQALFTLKRDIGAGDIARGVADVRLNTNVLTADVIDFETALRDGRVEDAAALYTGPFLDGVYVRESPEFERWAEDQRARLSREYGFALEKAAALATERGDVGQATAWWQLRSTHDPLSGRVARLYMEGLVKVGERERAIRHAATYATLVRKELEVDPDPEVLRLAESLREVGPAAAIPQQTALASAETARESVALRASDTAAAIPGRPLWFVAISGLMVILIALAATLAIRTVRDPALDKGLVAIGTFDNRTGDSRFDDLANRAATSLTQLLSQSSLVRVIDLRESMRNESGRQLSDRKARDVARRAMAAMMVTAQMTREGSLLVTNARVLDTSTGHLLYQSEPLKVAVAGLSAGGPAGLDESFLAALRESLGGAVLALNDSVFTIWRDGRSRPPSYHAYLEFKQGIDALVQQGPREAIKHLVTSMTLDPHFAQAKLWYLEQAIGRPAETLRFDSVRQALESQQNKLQAYDRAASDRQLAFIDGRLEDTYTAARQMVALAPQSADAKMLLAQASMATRRFREAINVLHQVHSRPMWFRNLSQRQNWDYQAHRLLGDAETGFAEWRTAAGPAPTDWAQCQTALPLLAATGREASVDSLFAVCAGVPGARTHPVGMHIVVGRIYRVLGNVDAANRAMRRAYEMLTGLVKEDSARRGELALLHFERDEWQQAYDILRVITDTTRAGQRVTFAVAAAHVGDTATARATERWLVGRSKREGVDMDRAFIQLALGERDRAIQSLRAAIEAGVAPAWNAWYTRAELHPLRNDPRFQELVRPR